MQLMFWMNEQPSQDADQPDSSGDTRWIGKAGEYIVAVELELAGYSCSLASEGLPYDIIAQRSDGSLCRVQVKTKHHVDTRGTYNRYRYKQYSQPLNEYRNIDVFAFVALDKRCAVFIPAAEITASEISIKEKDFQDANLRALSLSRAIAVE